MWIHGFDAARRVVWTRELCRQPAGAHIHLWTPDDALPNGIYQLTVEARGQCAAGMCVLLR